MAEKKRKRRTPWGPIIVGVVVLGGVGGAWAWQQQNAAGEANKLPTGVQVGRVERGDLEQKITASGVVAAQIGAKVNIGSQVSGRIKSLPADVGALVKVGQIVAVLDVQDLQAQSEQQRQAVAGAAATLDQSRARLRQAELTWQLTVEQNKAQISEAGFAVGAAQERLRQAELSANISPPQTSAEVARANAALSTAKAQQTQVKQTVALQLQQSQASIDEAQATYDNGIRTLRRQEALRQQGYVAQQEVDNAQATYRAALARLQNAKATLTIVKEKNQADLQAAENLVTQQEAAVRSAEAARANDQVRAADASTARQTVKQSEASLQLRKSNQAQNAISRRALEEARAAAKQAEANLKSAQAALDYQNTLLGRSVIRSPIAGTVLTVTAQQGETVAAAFQTPTLITVADLNRLEVKAYVDEVDIGRVKFGQEAEVRVESYQGRVFHGTVVKISSASTVKDNVVTYETTVRLKDANGMLRPDMTADVTLLFGRTRDVLLIPSEAIHRAVDRTVVYILHREKQGKERVEERTVTTGPSDGIKTQVRTGLKESEEVILTGLQRLGTKALDAQQQGSGGGGAEE